MALTTMITKETVKNVVKKGVEVATNEKVVNAITYGVLAGNVVDIVKKKRAKGLPKTYENNTMKFMGKSDIITTTLEA